MTSVTSRDWSEDWIQPDDLCQALSGPSTNTIPGCTTAATSTRFVPDDPNVLNTIETGLDTADRQFLMAGGEMTGATDPAIVSGAYGSDSETVIRVTFKVGPNTG